MMKKSTLAILLALASLGGALALRVYNPLSNYTNNEPASAVLRAGRADLKIPASSGIYLGAYDFSEGIEIFEKAVNKKAAIGNPSYIKDGGTGKLEGELPSFDVAGHERAFKAGYATTFGIEFRIPSDTVSPQAVIDGKIDKEIAEIAESIKNWGRPIFWLYQREPRIQPGFGAQGNGPKFGYDGGGYGPKGDESYKQVTARRGNPKAEYGNPRVLDGPERYIDACRHIHDLAEENAPNQITWVAGAGIDVSIPDTKKEGAPGLSYADFYPGSQYADWHAFDFYPDPAKPIKEQLERNIPRILKASPKNPIMIVEFGMADADTEQSAKKLKEAFSLFRKNYKQIKAILYFQNDWAENTRIEPESASAKVWKEEIKANPKYWISETRSGSGL